MNAPDNVEPRLAAIIVSPLSILVIAVFYVIRGYELEGKTLHVKRLGWRCRISLDELLSVYADPAAMKRSIRLFGNGGLFCFAGKFRNNELGSYRAFATDPKDAVVLKFRSRTIVVTPTDVDGFVRAIEPFCEKS